MTTTLSGEEQIQIDLSKSCTREIVAVHKENNVIMSVKIKNNGILTKKDVIQDIESGMIKYVVAKNTPVRVVADRYIQSVANDIEEDTLGSLPSF
jgi:urease accessory protein UreE